MLSYLISVGMGKGVLLIVVDLFVRYVKKLLRSNLRFFKV